jgi:hypothetical protein
MAPALLEHEDVGTTFNHPGKKKAINAIMATRGDLFAEFQAAWAEGPEAVIAFCETLPHIGAITKFHLAKNLGVDCAKPDVHLVRVADASGETPHGLCARLSGEAGDSVALVDYVIWRACQQRWRTDAASSFSSVAGSENDDEGSGDPSV